MDLKAISGIPAGLLPTVHRHTRTPELGNPELPSVQTHHAVSQRFPPFFPPLRLDAWLSFLPRPLPDFLSLPDSLLTVAQAIDGSPGSAFRRLFRDAPFLVALGYVLGFSLLFVAILRFLTLWHVVNTLL